MNFIVKNLGWILLLLFFVFMLFIISSSNPNPVGTNSGTLSLSWETSEVDSGLEELVEKMNESDEGEIVSDEVRVMNKDEKKEWMFSRFFGIFERKGVQNNELNSQDVSIDSSIVDTSNNTLEEKKIEKDENNIKEEENIDTKVMNEAEDEKKEGIISRIFGWKDEEIEGKNDNDEKEDSLKVENENAEENSLEEKNEDQGPKEELIVVASWDTMNKKSGHLGKVKNKMSADAHSRAQTYAPETLWMKAVNFPGTNLETKVWKSFEIGVHSLRINNKSFTQKLGYLMKGDSITQLSEENVYGCFLMKVETSVIASSIGKEGYVCKKYLQELSSDINNREEVVNIVAIDHEVAVIHEWEDEENNTYELQTNIGDIITTTKAFPFAGVILSPGTQLDQMSDGDSKGCFTARIFASENTAVQWKVWVVCEINLY